MSIVAARRMLHALKAPEGDRLSQLTVRNVSPDLIHSLKRRAAEHGRSAEAEHRDFLRKALQVAAEDFESRAKVLRARLRSTVDRSEIIRADRDRDGAA